MAITPNQALVAAVVRENILHDPVKFYSPAGNLNFLMAAALQLVEALSKHRYVHSCEQDMSKLYEENKIVLRYRINSGISYKVVLTVDKNGILTYKKVRAMDDMDAGFGFNFADIFADLNNSGFFRRK